ncbi:MAG: ammonium transporter [Candidatus Hydrogenedentes bacterium]|nr:ammonium transporter [Candidatus Hydrogenedentota bacterium]
MAIHVLGRCALAGLLLAAAPSAFAQEAGHIDPGTTAWMLISTALVLLMIPGLAMFYGGLVRTKNVIGTMMHSFAPLAIVGVLWTAVGYSLTFGNSIFGGIIGWRSEFVFLMGIDTMVEKGVPEYVLAMFQGKFAIITPALISGALAERVYFRGYCAFVTLWFLFVYCPLCHWVWGPGGWLLERGVIDLAGGLVIHVSAGTSALVAAIYLGARRGYPDTAMHPNNLVMTLMGAGLLWVGWFGFNAGSTLQSGMDTARALTMTQVSASSGALVWMIIEAIQFRKATALGFVSGILSGLVVITPAAGVVHPVGALALGAISSCACYIALNAKSKLGYDDSLDCFGIHGIGSGLGVLLMVFFLRSEWKAGALAADAGWTAMGQLGTQAIGMAATIAIAALGTLLISIAVEKTLGFRLPEQKEKAGLDHSLHGESGYGLLNLN